jgi:hypothetical protein
MTKEKNKGGRPTTYKEEYIQKVDEYLEICKDEYDAIVKQSNSEKGYEMYDNKLKVDLPTREGFSIFIDTALSTMDGWEKKHPEFSCALRKIEKEQKKRLINMGLSGEYNSTIAKLILSSNHGMTERTDHTTKDEKIEPVSVILKEIDGTTKDLINE